MRDILGIVINNPSEKLAPLTDHRNPITLPFFARYRLIDFELSNMVNSKIAKIGLIASDKYRSLLDHVGTGQEWGLSRKSQSLIILQGTRRLGGQGTQCVNLVDFEQNRNIFKRNLNADIIISSPDVVCRIDYQDVERQHDATDADITMITTPVDIMDNQTEGIYFDVNDRNTVEDVAIGKNNQFEQRYAGKMIIKRETLMKLMRIAHELGEYEMMTLIKGNLNYLNVKCYTYQGYLRRIETIQDYFNTSMELLDIGISHKLFSGEQTVYTKIKDNHPTLYKPESDVKGSCVASGCIIHGTVDKSVLFRHVMQEAGSIVSNSILMEGCEIGEGAQLDYVIADRNVKIGKNVVLKGSQENPVILKKEMRI